MMEPPSPTRAPRKSFVDIVGRNSGSVIKLKTSDLHKGEPAVFFSKDEIGKMASTFKLALVWRFSHRRPPLAEIRFALTAIGLKASVTVGLIDNKHVLLQFAHDMDFQRIWLKELWYLKSYPMRVFKWSPDFRVEAEPLVARFGLTYRSYHYTSSLRKVYSRLVGLLGIR